MKLMGSMVFAGAIGFGVFVVYHAAKIIVEIAGTTQ